MKYLLIDIESCTPEEIKTLMRLSPNILTEEQSLEKFKETWDKAILWNVTKDGSDNQSALLNWEDYSKHL